MSKNIVETEVDDFCEDIMYDFRVEAREDGNYLVLQLDTRQWIQGPFEEGIDLESHCEDSMGLLHRFFEGA